MIQMWSQSLLFYIESVFRKGEVTVSQEDTSRLIYFIYPRSDLELFFLLKTSTQVFPR
jgi:hypothetical protein